MTRRQLEPPRRAVAAGIRAQETPHREPASLRGILAELMKSMRPAAAAAGSDPSRLLAEISRIWERAVGPEIAQLTEVRRYRGGVMTVAVAANPLMAELKAFAKRELIATLAENGLAGIHELRFTAASETDSKERSRTVGGTAAHGRGATKPKKGFRSEHA
ncbi:MAG: DUF721 domain-containing protein [Planctomycetes bacterium]|nr:DUF721 domain-containing protein [Planctomycetota bacterium]